MASNGLNKRAKKGVCRMCLRRRKTDEQVKAVGDVLHGFATGHIWECIDIEDCNKTIERKLIEIPEGSLKHHIITNAVKYGRFTEYKYVL